MVLVWMSLLGELRALAWLQNGENGPRDEGAYELGYGRVEVHDPQVCS